MLTFNSGLPDSKSQVLQLSRFTEAGVPTPLLGSSAPSQLLREAPPFASKGCSWWQRAEVGLGWSFGQEDAEPASPGAVTMHFPHPGTGVSWQGCPQSPPQTPWPPCAHRGPHTDADTQIPRLGSTQPYVCTRLPTNSAHSTLSPPHQPVHTRVCVCPHTVHT